MESNVPDVRPKSIQAGHRGMLVFQRMQRRTDLEIEIQEAGLRVRLNHSTPDINTVSKAMTRGSVPLITRKRTSKTFRGRTVTSVPLAMWSAYSI